MKYDPSKHHRKSTRLRGYDYSSPGAYFVTLNLQNRNDHLFGEIVDGQMQLSELGGMVQDEWIRTPDIRREIALDAFVVMPNHMHAIIWICDPGRGIRPDAPTKVKPTLSIFEKHGPDQFSLGAIMAGFKSITTKQINMVRGTQGTAVWQRNFNDHIIRGSDELARIRHYIVDNPIKWNWKV